MSNYIIGNNSTTITINETISSLSINGSNNKIVINSKIPNLLINGCNNKISTRNTQSTLLMNVVFNGSNNSINIQNTNFQKINNGVGNKLNGQVLNSFGIGGNFNVFNNFQNSNFNIHINGRNMNHLSNQIANIINLVANNNDEYDDENEEGSYTEEEEEENSEEESEENEQRRIQLINKRNERILNFDEFQFKHAGKYLEKIEDSCAICLEKFKGTDIVKLFYCEKHVFHKKCLLTWLKKSNTCPLCKKDFIADLLNPGEEFMFE